jgi:TetR/AcrR family acrAB operon transcriptional repressor
MNDERRERVLDAAQQLFLRYGYDKTTVSDIAKQAGISKGAIYLHFASKEAVMDALLIREGERVQADIVRRMSADPDGGSLFSIYRHSLEALVENELMRAFYARRRQVFGDVLRRLEPTLIAREMRGMSVEFVRQYQAAGLIRPELDPEAVAFLFAFMRYGLLTIDEVIPRDQSPPLSVIGPLIAQVLQLGLAPQGGGDNEAGKRLFESLASAALDRLKRQQEPPPAHPDKGEGT